MFKFSGSLHKHVVLLLVLAGFIVGFGLFIERGGDEFTLQNAVGQTNETLQTLKGQDLEDFQYLERANRAFIKLVNRVRPSIVEINTKTQRTRQSSQEQFRQFFDLDRFFRDFEDRAPQQDEEPSIGIGSGVIISDDGYILTNNHVIEGVDEMTVILADRREYPAELIGRDAAGISTSGTDLAVLKIDAEGLPVIPFGDSDALEVGEWVIAIGAPLNLSQTVTRGIVSAKGRYSNLIRYGNFIQTDAPINQGNSGGALINIRGELVGINTLIATRGFSGGNIGIGFAVPSNIVQQNLTQLIENGKVIRGWLGIRMQEVNHDLAEKLQLDKPRGALVSSVMPESPAHDAGIQRGDVVIAFDGVEIRDITHLMHTVALTEVGKSVDVIVLRRGGKGKEERLTVKLGERTEEVLARFNEEQESGTVVPEKVFAGLHVRELTRALAERHGHSPDETGVIVTRVSERSHAARKGIRSGDLIQEMEYIRIRNLEDYSDVVNQLREKNEKRVLLYVKSPNRRRARYISLNINSDDR